jgi:hypothetical protein
MLLLKNRLCGRSNFEEMFLCPRGNVILAEKAHSVRVIRSGGKQDLPVYASESYPVHNHTKTHVWHTVSADD